jgi:hypothetical protein
MEEDRIREVIGVGKLGDFTGEVDHVIRKIWARGFPVHVTQYAGEESMVVWIDDGTPKWVKLRIKPDNLGLSVLWDLLHEYGHILDGYAGRPSQLPPALQWQREVSAWVNAEKEISAYPRLIGYMQGFYTHRDYCLNSYRRMLAAEYGYKPD